MSIRRLRTPSFRTAVMGLRQVQTISFEEIRSATSMRPTCPIILTLSIRSPPRFSKATWSSTTSPAWCICPAMQGTGMPSSRGVILRRLLIKGSSRCQKGSKRLFRWWSRPRIPPWELLRWNFRGRALFRGLPTKTNSKRQRQAPRLTASAKKRRKQKQTRKVSPSWFLTQLEQERLSPLS